MLADELGRRRATVQSDATLRALADRLRRFAEPLLNGEPVFPAEKPLLSRDGGVCPRDGARLLFDPLSPRRHACPVCACAFEGERHYRAWIWRYHLWLSERAIHLALLAALTDERGLAARAAAILEGYAALYPTVPNRDNVLGPTRLFFSTYLESLWLVQLVVAGLLLGATGQVDRDGLHRALDPVVGESRRLIASFDEGLSNRQAWNTTALFAAACWLNDRTEMERQWARLADQLRAAVTGEGLWFEGENYHFFALRAVVLAAELRRWSGSDPYADARVGPRLTTMFTAPLDSVLPDLTLPARGDAPYGVSLVQPRFADLWEVGLARTGAERLSAVLAELYAQPLPGGPDLGATDIAEQEVNRPPARLARTQLSWKALWCMRPDPPAPGPWRAPSGVYHGGGLALLRWTSDRYASVECRARAAGHGHPDALHLTVAFGEGVLKDFGTGSYVRPSLHWYRSTLAHNAPGVAGTGQLPGRVWCAALEERDGWAWCRAVALDLLGAGTRVTRSVVAGPTWVLDVVDVAVNDDIVIDLPVHALGGVSLRGPARTVTWRPEGGAAHESGYDRVESVVEAGPGAAVAIPGVTLAPRPDERLFVARAPGPPSLWFADGEPLDFVVRRAAGAGRWVALVHDAGTSFTVEADEGEIVVGAAPNGVRVTLDPGAATVRLPDGRVLRLSGARPAPQPSEREVRAVRRPRLACPRLARIPLPGEWQRIVPERFRVALGAAAYRRTEEPYGARGPFHAEASVFAAEGCLCFAVAVVKAQLVFRAPDAPDPALDNEPPEIHSDGVQCYVADGDWRGWVLVPRESSDAVHVRAVGGTAARASHVRARWCRTADGYTMVAAVTMAAPLAMGDVAGVNLVINEMYPDRERRAGQLVLAGGAGWAYLRGDRESPRDVVPVEVV